jgi:hypothetical protein
MSNYEYQRTPGGLGWSKNWEIPMSDQVARNVSCAGGGTLTCASSDEQSFMANQGCVPSVYGPNGLDACRESSGQDGSLFCCPPGRPGTGTSPATTVAQRPVNNQNITALQNFIIQQGCSVGSTGADGVYGPNTAAGLRCAIERSSYVNVASRFPFITTLMATPTGQPRPDSFTFNPGSSGKTPEQVVSSGGGGGAVATNTGSTREDIQVDRQQRQQQAGVIGGLPWWGWALIAAGGVGLLGVIGLVALGDDEEDELRGRGYDEDDYDLDYYGGGRRYDW